MNLLEVQKVSVHFQVSRGWGSFRHMTTRAVDSVSFSIRAGETVGLVGESGCGKTTLGRAVMRLVPTNGGSIHFQGQDITHLAGAKLRKLRQCFQIVFQDPYGSLDPRMTVQEILNEPFDIHQLAKGPEREQRRKLLLSDVGLDETALPRYPHEFSGGQRQRIGIARALAVEPCLIVCDEPVSALDVSVQAQVINLLRDLQMQRGLAYLFIGHDLAVVEHISHRIMVMYLGKIVEFADSKAICHAPRHPYTQALLSAIPVLDPETRRARTRLTGDLPSPLAPPQGCPFHPRCPMAESRCRTEIPALRELETGHQVACHLA
jgi:peptide/nickel transport system ATP-binding protein